MNDLGKGILGDREATGEQIREAMGHAIDAALRAHKQARNPVAVWDWERQCVAWIPPEEIEVCDDFEEASAESPIENPR